MNIRPSGPQPADWFTASVRGLHPLRLFMCAGGVAFTLLGLALAESLLTGESARWSGWWEQPVEQARTFRNEIGEHSFLRAAVRFAPLVGAVTAVWCLAGCWIARHELAARDAARPYVASTRFEPGPTKLVVTQFKSLLACCPLVLILICVSFLPVLIAGLLNHWMGGLGAILVAIFLWIVLLADLFLLVLLVGFFAWPLMPVTIAAENSDNFDALSRSYNYTFEHLIVLLLLNVAAIAIASIPVLIVLYPLAESIAGWPPVAGQLAFWTAAVISASIFWSLQTLVYLHLRALVDDVDASEVAVGAETAGAAQPPPPAEKSAAAPAAAAPDRKRPFAIVRINFLMLLMVVLTWIVTVWLFMRLGGEETGWINWGLGDTFRPAAPGLYGVASFIAGFMGIVWIGVPLYMAIRGLFRGDEVPTKQPEAGKNV